MAPAVDVEELTAYFEQCGLAPKAANETARGKQAQNAKALFTANKLETRNLDNKQALFAFQLVKDGAKLSDESKAYVIEAILDQRLKGSDQVTGETTRGMST
jgi:glutaminyl-tRNA synthetase